ncbi:MAG: NAD(P)H-dependent oxidoreductase [Gammaproteobacteria bacterium]|nr:NAD(P)H-dependent oxidoreductase [Gammaproteobacteria bacterium]
MKITIISGSHRENSQSSKVALHMQAVLEAKGINTDILDLAGNPLPLWDQGVWEGDEKWVTLLTPIKEQLASSDGFVVISPEWHGQVPAGLKNLFLLMSKNELGHKPAMITAVSSGDGGSYPVAELRMSSYKNNRLCYIPEHLILRNIESILNKDESLNDESSNDYFKQRIEWSLGVLEQYAIALKIVRDSGAADTEQFNNGM